MSIIDNWLANITGKIAQAVADRVLTAQGQRVAQARAFRLGKQPKQLKVKSGQYDDNLILNFTGLIIDRAVSQMLGGGVTFTFEDAGEDSQQAEYIEDVWEANRKNILLHRAELAASEAGTGYFLLCDPALGMGSAVGADGTEYPRILLLDPAYLTMDTHPEDFEIVFRYVQQYKTVGADGKELLRRKTIEQDDGGAWVIIDEENGYGTSGQWREVGRLEWPYEFPPVIHWQNLPTVDSPYGEPDVTEDLMELQNKLNGDASFLSKSLRLGVHPLRWGKGLENISVIDNGPDKLLKVGSDGDIQQLTPAVDWNGALAFFKLMRTVIFDTARTVDIDSLEDKLGSLTNFALKVIYQDNASKIATKRELMEEALVEINRRLQIMAGMQPVKSDVIWPDFMPVNVVEEMTAHQQRIEMGLESPQTASERFGLDYDEEQERIAAHKATNDNVGSLILQAFNNGGGGLEIPGRAPQVTNREE